MSVQPDHIDKQKEVTGLLILKALSKADKGKLTTIAERRRERCKPVILVVDDDLVARTLVCNVLKKKYDWVSVQDGEHALMQYINTAPDVLILDIGLPDINGHDILNCVLQMDPEAYAVMFSRRRDKKNVMQAAQEGAQGYIVKPFTREKLLQYINHSPHIQDKQKQEVSYAHTAD